MSFDVGINLFFHRRGLCGNALFEENAQNCQDIFLNNFVLQIRITDPPGSAEATPKAFARHGGQAKQQRGRHRFNEEDLPTEQRKSRKRKIPIPGDFRVFSGQNYYPARGRGTGVGRGGRRTEKTNRPSRCIDCMRKRIGLAAKSSARRLKSIGQKGSQIKFEPLFPSPAAPEPWRRWVAFCKIFFGLEGGRCETQGVTTGEVEFAPLVAERPSSA